MDTTNILNKIRTTSPIINKKEDTPTENNETDIELALKDDVLKDEEIKASYAFYKLYSNVEEIKKPIFLSEKIKELIEEIKGIDNIKLSPSDKGSSENKDFIASIVDVYKLKIHKSLEKPHDTVNKDLLKKLFEDKENNSNCLHLSTINDFMSSKKNDDLYGILQTINLTLLQNNKFNYPEISKYYDIIEEKYPDSINFIREEPLPKGVMDGVLSNQDINGFIDLVNNTLKTKLKKLPVPPQLKDVDREKQINAANKAMVNQMLNAFKNGGITGLVRQGVGLAMNQVGKALTESKSISSLAHLMEEISIDDDYDFSQAASKEELVAMLKTDHEKEADAAEKEFMEKVLPTVTSEYLRKALTTYSLQDDNNFLQNLFNTISRKMYLSNPDKGEVLYEWDDKTDNVFYDLCPAFKEFLNQEESLRELDEQDLDEKEYWLIDHPEYQEALDNFGDNSILNAKSFYGEDGKLLTLEQLIEKGYNTEDYSLGSDIEKSEDKDAINNLWNQLAERDANGDNILNDSSFHDEKGNLLTIDQLVEKGYNMEDYQLGSDIDDSPDKEKIEKLWSQLPENKDELEDEHILRIKDVTDEKGNVLTSEQLAEKEYNTNDYTLSKEICNSEIYDKVLEQWKNLDKVAALKNAKNIKNNAIVKKSFNINNASETETDNTENKNVQESISFIADLMKHKLI